MSCIPLKSLASPILNKELWSEQDYEQIYNLYLQDVELYKKASDADKKASISSIVVVCKHIIQYTPDHDCDEYENQRNWR